MQTTHIISRPSLLLTLCLATTMVPSLAAAATATGYPLLPDLPGADISGQARIAIHLDQGLTLVELDGQLHALGDRPLEVAFDDLDRITLLFIVPQDTGILVTEDGLWIDELEPSAVSTVITFDLVDPLMTFGFELTLPGQPAPTVPDLVILPTENDPDPA